MAMIFVTNNKGNLTLEIDERSKNFYERAGYHQVVTHAPVEPTPEPVQELEPVALVDIAPVVEETVEEPSPPVVEEVVQDEPAAPSDEKPKKAVKK